jgi:hypothetical protein
MRVFSAFVLVASLLVLAACGSASNSSGASADRHGNGACVSGDHWSGNESSHMRPGEDCVGCHATNGGPDFALAGTIFTNYDEPNDCNGAPSMKIKITDAASPAHVYNLESNSAGNFFVLAAGAGSLTYPISVVVTDADGNTRAMEEPQMSGACNSCHTSSGANGAPGRVITP